MAISSGVPNLPSGTVSDIAWLKPDGTEMTVDEWNHDFARCLGVYLVGDALDELDDRGRPAHDDSFLVLFNAHHETITFRIAEVLSDKAWTTVLDTAFGGDPFALRHVAAGEAYALQGRSLVLLEETAPARIRNDSAGSKESAFGADAD